MTGDDPLRAIGEIFERVGVGYALIGGHAVNAYLEPRVTANVYVTVVASPTELATLSRALEEARFVCERVHGEGLPSGPDFQRWLSDGERVVLEIQTGKTAFQARVVERAIGSCPRIAAPEDLVVLKLIADRPKDQADLVGLTSLPDLDWRHIETWAREWGVDDKLGRYRK